MAALSNATMVFHHVYVNKALLGSTAKEVRKNTFIILLKFLLKLIIITKHLVVLLDICKELTCDNGGSKDCKNGVPSCLCPQGFTGPYCETGTKNKVITKTQKDDLHFLISFVYFWLVYI